MCKRFATLCEEMYERLAHWELGWVTFLPEATTFLQINASWGNLPVQKQQGKHLTGFVIFL